MTIIPHFIQSVDSDLCGSISAAIPTKSAAHPMRDTSVMAMPHRVRAAGTADLHASSNEQRRRRPAGGRERRIGK